MTAGSRTAGSRPQRVHSVQPSASVLTTRIGTRAASSDDPLAFLGNPPAGAEGLAKKLGAGGHSGTWSHEGRK
jgi:hypothetical protein